MKLLWFGESPYIETGAGQVAKHLLPVFESFFDEIHLVAINQWFDPFEKIPQHITLTKCDPKDMFNTENALKAISKCDYDFLFLTTDINRITELEEGIRLACQKDIPIIMYGAIDSQIYAPGFWNILNYATIPVVFSQWAIRQCHLVIPPLAKRLRAIYHGCEPDVFYPLENRDAVRKDMYDIDDNTFLVTNVNRNQIRKDLMRTMCAFHLFHQKYPNSILYLHAKHKDNGGYLPGQAEYLGLKVRGPHAEVFFAPNDYTEINGLSRSDLNKIYNCADVVVSTSTGEGWGLTTTEAMAAQRPFIGPHNTVFPEILGDGTRGYLVESGGPNLWVTFYGTSDCPRELTSTTEMAKMIEHVYHNREEAARKAEWARIWTQQHTWEMKQQEWTNLFLEMGFTQSKALATA